MSELGYELPKDILGRKDSTCPCPGTKSTGGVSGAMVGFREKGGWGCVDEADQTQILLGFS